MDGAVASLTVISFAALVFPALSVAVTVTFVPAFCLGMETVYFPSVLAFAVPIAYVPTFTVRVEPASAIPVTFVDLSVIPFTLGTVGGTSSTGGVQEESSFLI